jgi:hypothetical protein
MNLYDVKTRREYTEEYKAKWKSRDYETIYPQWGETWGEVRARIEERNKPGKYPGFDKMYRDKLISVVRVSDEDLAARRAAARRYRLCCDKAILRNCVCSYSITCPEHGVKCHGSHD